MAHTGGTVEKEDKGWVGKILNEVLRFAVVGTVALALAYWGLGSRVGHMKEKLDKSCASSSHVEANQKAILFTLLDLLQILSDNPNAHLNPIAPGIRIRVLTAIANLPLEAC